MPNQIAYQGYAITVGEGYGRQIEFEVVSAGKMLIAYAGQFDR
ncbi:hypothetical protein [Candidatus Binatus sp.]